MELKTVRPNHRAGGALYTPCSGEPTKTYAAVLKRVLLTMKLTVIILLAACLTASAKGYSQKITLSEKNAPIEKVFAEIRKQAGYYFFYDLDDLKASIPVTINIKNADLAQALAECFKNQPLIYTIINKTVVVKPKGAEIAVTVKAPSQENPLPPVDISGRITNNGGEPLAGASVIIKRTGKGTTTNAEGVFRLNVSAGDVLVISFVGYDNAEYKITPAMVASSNQQSTPGTGVSFTVSLKQAEASLNEVVLNGGYYTTSKKLSTGNIAKVTAEEIGKQPVMNALIALEGKVPGLEISQTSGYASGPVKIELRGRTPINPNFQSDPLYIVDGVPLTINSLNDGDYHYGSAGFLQNGLGGPAGGQSLLFSISPSDIESIEILKDGDATAIYGSRGANGVMLITTKRAKQGAAKFDLNIQQGVTRVTRYFDLLNTQQYLAMRHEAFKNDGLTPDPVYDFDINGTWDTTRYTDWQRALYGRMGQSTTVSAGLSAGNAQTSYRIGASYSRVTDITTASGSDQRAALSLNLQQRSINQRFKMSLTGNYSFTKSDMVSIPGVATIAPDAPAIYDENGHFNYAGWGGQDDNASARQSFPFSSLQWPYVAKTNFLNAGLLLSYNILKELAASVNIGYNTAWNNQTFLTPISSQDPELKPTGRSTWGSNQNNNWIIEPQLTYTKTIGKGSLSALVGGSLQQTNTEGLRITGMGYVADDLLSNLSGAPDKTVDQFSGEYKYTAIFGRITYNWQNKYVISFNGRRDGSSRFGPGKQFGNFGSVGAAWLFSEEGWFKKLLPVVSFGKLRSSYGTTGSDAIGDYQYISQYSTNLTYPYGGNTTYVPVIQANPDYRWQVNKKLEVALELGLLKDRINMQVAYYQNRCGNQLIGFPLSSLTGFNSVVANSPALVENKGWEYNASARLLQTKNFSWSVNFNIAFNRNRLLAYPNIGQSPFANTYIIGQPLNIKRLFHFTGVDPLTGLPSFEDKNHDGQITADFTGKTVDDRYPVDLSPKYFGGFGTNLTYKGLTLGLFFNYKKQVGVNALTGNHAGQLNVNTLTDLLDRWQKPGDIKPYPAFTTTYSKIENSYFYSSNGIYTDASFVRLANLSLSYTIPSTLTRRAKLGSCSIFINANNLLTITAYKGADPESQSFGGLPPTRTIVGGISIQF